jgi:hypothetical protein
LLRLQGRQSFSLHNVKLSGSLSGAVVTLTFRWDRSYSLGTDVMLMTALASY